MRIRIAFASLALLSLVVSACGTETATDVSGEPVEMTETTIDQCVIDQGTTPAAEPTGAAPKTLKSGILTIGSDTAFPPFESIDGGKAVGFDVDLITEVAERLELEAEVQTSAFDTIFTSLAAGKFDAVVSAVTIKEERKKTVDFTDPYFDSDQSLSVRSEDAESITGVDDLADKIVGVQAATTGEDCAKTALLAKKKVKDVRSFDTAPDAFTDLAAGRVDAVLVDLPVAKQVVEQREGAAVVQAIRTKEEYGIAVSKENPDLRVAINEQLAAIRDDGTYDTIYKKWLKTEPPE